MVKIGQILTAGRAYLVGVHQKVSFRLPQCTCCKGVDDAMTGWDDLDSTLIRGQNPVRPVACQKHSSVASPRGRCRDERDERSRDPLLLGHHRLLHLVLPPYVEGMRGDLDKFDRQERCSCCSNVYWDGCRSGFVHRELTRSQEHLLAFSVLPVQWVGHNSQEDEGSAWIRPKAQ